MAELKKGWAQDHNQPPTEKEKESIDYMIKNLPAWVKSLLAAIPFIITAFIYQYNHLKDNERIREQYRERQEILRQQQYRRTF